MSDPLTTPDRDDTVSEPERYGTIVLEYVNVPHDGHTYALTFEGQVLRMFYGSPWRPYYTVQPTAVAEHVASVRLASHQRVTVDRWRKPVPDIARPGWMRGAEPPSTEETMTETTDEPKEEVVAKTETPPKEKAPPKETKATPKTNGAAAPKLGANAKRVLEGGLDLSKTRQKEVLAAANDLAIARGDRITRIWDVYEAAGAALPAKVADAKKEYLETGRMPKSGGGGGRGNAQEGAPKSPTPDQPPSKTPSAKPESKPTASTESDPGETEKPSTPPQTDDETL